MLHVVVQKVPVLLQVLRHQLRAQVWHTHIIIVITIIFITSVIMTVTTGQDD